VFCEKGVFTADQSRRILEAAAAYGMTPRLHADELAPSGGAELAAELGALSAGPSRDAVRCRDRRPGAGGRDGSAGRGHAAACDDMVPDEARGAGAPARKYIDAGIPVALGTDFNPGTSPTPSLPLVLSLACLELKLSPAEALVAATINAAYAIGLGDELGSLEAGKQADSAIWRVPTAAQIPYFPGADLVEVVVKRGGSSIGGARAERRPARAGGLRSCRATPGGRSSSRSAGSRW
jgi:imidazolonepropionase